jgi:hypothetical protein
VTVDKPGGIGALAKVELVIVRRKAADEDRVLQRVSARSSPHDDGAETIYSTSTVDTAQSGTTTIRTVIVSAATSPSAPTTPAASSTPDATSSLPLLDPAPQLIPD